MTLVSTTPVLQTETEDNNNSTNIAEALTVSMDAEFKAGDEKTSPMPGTTQVPLQQLFEQAMAQQGASPDAKIKWVGDNEVQIDGLSNMTLHNFILKAEALGKKVSYRRSIVLTITD